MLSDVDFIPQIKWLSSKILIKICILLIDSAILIYSYLKKKITVDAFTTLVLLKITIFWLSFLIYGSMGSIIGLLLYWYIIDELPYGRKARNPWNISLVLWPLLLDAKHAQYRCRYGVVWLFYCLMVRLQRIIFWHLEIIYSFLQVQSLLSWCYRKK